MEEQSGLQLDDSSQIAVIGGGPAGSFFSYFLLDMAERVGIDIQVDICEPKDFSHPGPGGCNHCGGVVHESLVQYIQRLVAETRRAGVVYTTSLDTEFIRSPDHQRLSELCQSLLPHGRLAWRCHMCDKLGR